MKKKHACLKLKNTCKLFPFFCVVIICRVNS